jgi:beta-lactamase regulating signal transducer with metallopeptidase domain
MSDLLLNVTGTGWAASLLSGLLLFTLRATVVLLGAWGATRLLRGASAATRHLVWTAAITAVLILPLLSVVMPKWNVPVVELTAKLDAPAAATSPDAAVAASQAPAPAEAPTSAAVSPEIERFTETAASAPSTWSLPQVSIEASDVVAGAWLVIMLILVIRLAIANARVLSWKRASRLVEDARWNSLLRRLTRQHEIERPVVLLESPETDVPVTWGIVYPVVLLPAASVEWDDEQRIAVLTHELAHVKRFDALSQMLAQLALALLWFHPLAWLAVRRMRLEREHACDDFVLVAGARASRYADDLLGLARRLGRPTAPAAAALAMARRSELEGRLLAILDPTAKRTAVRGARAGALTLLMVTLTLPIAAFSPGARVVTLPTAASTTIETTQRVVTDVPIAKMVVQTPAPAPAPIAPTEQQSLRMSLDSLLRGATAVSKLPNRLPDIGRIASAPLRIVRDTEPLAPVDVDILVEVTRGVKRMTSDYEKGQLLAQVAKRYVRTDSLRDAYLAAVFSMTSDYERSKALIALLERDSIPATHTAKVLNAAAMMTSDVSRGVVLRKISPLTFADTTVQKAYLGVINAMTSNVERANAISSLVRQKGLSQGVQLALIRGISAITSNTDKANALLVFLESQGTADPVVRRSFLKSAETLTSDSDYRRVMTAMMR